MGVQEGEGKGGVSFPKCNHCETAESHWVMVGVKNEPTVGF